MIDKKWKLLIVDDDEGMRLMMKRILTKEKIFEIKSAENGIVAENMIKEYIPDLIILDVMMPYQDGKTTYKSIRMNERLKCTKILGVSGSDRSNCMGINDEFRVDAFLLKPFETSTFRRTILNLVYEQDQR